MFPSAAQQAFDSKRLSVTRAVAVVLALLSIAATTLAGAQSTPSIAVDSFRYDVGDTLHLTDNRGSNRTLIVEDIAMVLTLVLLPALSTLLGGRSGESETHDIGGLIGMLGPLNLWQTLAVTALKVTAFVALMIIVGRRLVPWVLHYIAHTGSRELFRLAVLAIALGIAFGSAQLFGVSFALGAFFAGMILAESELSHQAAQETLPLRDAFAVLFFVSVGMLFDPMILVREPLLVLATTFIIMFGKSAAAYLIVRGFGHPKSTALTISASLAQIGEFSFILAALGMTLGVMSRETHDLILAAALISIALNPFVFALDDQHRVDEMQPARAEVDPSGGHCHGIVGKDGFVFHHALAQADTATVLDVDGGDDAEGAGDGHGARRS